MDLQIDVGDGVAVAAFVIAVWSAVRTDRFNKRQTVFEQTSERLNLILIGKEAEESEAQKRADISANFYQAGKGDYRLKVFNRGRGTAKNVKFESMDQGSLFMEDDIMHQFPIPRLEQHQSIELIGAMHNDSPRRAHIKLTWDDESGQGHAKELHPSW